MVLAKFGNIKAQHNLAVMYTNGQGVKQNLPNAYAWSKISDHQEKYKKLTRAIEKQLTDSEKQEAKILLVEFHKKFAYENSKILLGPVVKLSKGEKDAQLKTKPITKFPPIYPMELLARNIQGWVDLGFNIYPDGSVRDMYVSQESPVGAFAKEAMRTLEKYRYAFYRNEIEVDITEPIARRMRMTFTIAATTNRFTLKQQSYLRKLIKEANDGNVHAQYSYAILYDTFLNRKSEIKAEKINEWLFNAAQEGVVDAQYHLGKKIYYGKDCKEQKQKGLDWIIKAAQSGNSDAEFMTYQMLQNSKVINQSNQSPLYWLEKAAENGSSIAQLRYTLEIAKLDNLTKNQLKTVKSYLKSYAKKHYKTIQWYQAKALVLTKSKKYSKALINIKTALKRAEQRNWDITELVQIRDDIQKYKNNNS